MYYSLYIIAAAAAVFVAEIIAPQAMLSLFAFTPAKALLMPWVFITSVFMHAGPFHLFLNMFALFMFGPLLEHKVGSRKFLYLFLAAGIIGNIGYFLYAYALGDPAIPGIGASGAIYGVLGALAVLEPNLPVLAYPFFLPVPLWMAAIGWIFIEFVSIGAQDLVGRAAHLGGIFLGIAYAFLLKKKTRRLLEFWE